MFVFVCVCVSIYIYIFAKSCMYINTNKHSQTHTHALLNKWLEVYDHLYRLKKPSLAQLTAGKLLQKKIPSRIHQGVLNKTICQILAV